MRSSRLRCATGPDPGRLVLMASVGGFREVGFGGVRDEEEPRHEGGCCGRTYQPPRVSVRIAFGTGR